MGKSSKIRCIVLLRQMLRRWRHRASSRSSSTSVPAGHVAVCVGPTFRRFVVPAAHLNHPALRELLLQAAEEYGFSRPGPLSLPCDESLFEHALRHVTSSSATSAIEGPLCCCHVGLRSSWHAADSLPLLHGFAEKSVCGF